MATYFFIIVLVGIPGIAGAIIFTESAGRRSVSNGASLLIYAFVLTATVTHAYPVDRFTGANYAIKFPAVLAVAIVIGVVIGLIRRRKRSG